MRFYPLLFLIAFASILLTGLEKFAEDPGVGWHLETGRWILQHGRIPYFDPFLHAAAPRAWVSDQWFSDIIFALIFNSGGFALLYGVLICLFLSAFFLVLAPAIKRTGVSYMAAAIAALFAFKVAEVHLILRPVVVGIFLFALLNAALVTYQRDKRLLLGLPLLFLFWTNLHPSFSLGLIYLGLTVAGLFLDQFFFSPSYSEGEVRTRTLFFGKLLLLCALATLINPYGYKLHQSIFELGSSAFFMNYHQEWHSPDFASSEGQLFQLLLAGTFLSFFVRGQKLRPPTMVDFLLICFFTHASLDAVRFLPFFGIVAAPYFARSFSILSQLENYPGEELVQIAWERINQREARGFPDVRFCAAIFILFFGYIVLCGQLPLFSGEYGPRTKVYPYQELDYLKLHGATVVASEPGYGGFITWKGEGRVRALIDDRNALLGENFYKEYERAFSGNGDWLGYFRNLGTSHLLVLNDSGLAKVLRETNALPVAFEGPIATIFPITP